MITISRLSEYLAALRNAIPSGGEKIIMGHDSILINCF